MAPPALKVLLVLKVPLVPRDLSELPVPSVLPALKELPVLRAAKEIKVTPATPDLLAQLVPLALLVLMALLDPPVLLARWR
ncbi:hypothetical protein KDK_09080 [Dictyobacter kobayashii]|uniref:Uncharacterized protein n=1 Tax=Dictyobacter kobayashii TaxID=2014872 RepID=A0A402ADE1_9CHLR|nr:hypothetical protein KDK_09080 [Dictyobacter kobayashii]